MGKKKKKGGKKDGKEDVMTFAEALLAYQIHVKENIIKEFQGEVKQLEEKNKRYKERNERLKKEQLGHVKTLLKQAKEKEKELRQKEVVNKEQVEQALKEKWELAKDEERMLKELHSQINDLQHKILQRAREQQYWLEYKNVGHMEHTKQISLLERELQEMQRSFDELEDHFRKTLEALKNKINTQTEKQMDEKKQLASEKAINKLDKESCQEIRENEWLKREANIYRTHVAGMDVSVQKLEQENLELMSHLFDCRLEDLKISRNVFLTQVAGLDVSETDVLEEDFAKLELGTIADPTTGVQPAIRFPRPTSATLQAVEHKVFSSLIETEREEEEGEGDDQEETHLLQSASQELSCLLYGDQEHFKEYLQLGPLELKLLRIVGRSMSIQNAESLQKTDTQDNGMAVVPRKEDWPITPEIIHSAFTEKSAVAQANTNTLVESK